MTPARSWHADQEKIEEIIAMTTDHRQKKKIRHPLRMGAVVAASMALLTIGAQPPPPIRRLSGNSPSISPLSSTWASCARI